VNKSMHAEKIKELEHYPLY